MRPTATILVGDVMEQIASLPDESVHLCVTSPPYWSLRSYLPTDHPDKAREMGSEPTMDCLGWATGAPCGVCHVCRLVAVMREVRRVLRRDGVAWVNYGDAYTTRMYSHDSLRNVSVTNGEWCKQGQRGEFAATQPPSTFGGLKPKDMCLLPSRLALALQADGWWVRSIAPWVKRSCLPSSVGDRPSTSLEWMMMLTKSARYYWDAEAVRRKAEYGRREHPEGWVSGTQNGDGHRSGGGSVTGKDPSAGRNLRDSDWWFDTAGMLLRDEILGFDVMSEPSSDAHYASFPRKLVRDIVLAGSSGAGVCGAMVRRQRTLEDGTVEEYEQECGAPWRRCVEKRSRRAEREEYGGLHSAMDPSANGRRMLLNMAQAREAGGDHDNPFPAPITLGFRPSCSHADAPRVPATILDPFCGRATTGVVALEYGRSFIGIELSEQYAAMARRRLAAVECQPLLDVTASEPAPVRQEQSALELEVG